jgi:uncharacterized FlgJ-related protein
MMLSKTKSRQNVKSSPNKFARDHVLPLIDYTGFHDEMGKILLAQAAFETGNFTSEIFKDNNNMFGMKLPKQRKTTAIGEKHGHATYNSIEENIEDMRLYFNAKKISPTFNTVDSYINKIREKNYFESDPDEYKAGVIYYYNLYFTE